MTRTNGRRAVRWRLMLAAGAIMVASGVGVGVALAADDRGPTYGTIPEDAYGADGSIDLERVPDYVVAFGRDGEPAGYVARDDLFASGDTTVVDGDGTTIGHLRPGHGFIAVDENSSTLVPIQASAGPMTEN